MSHDRVRKALSDLQDKGFVVVVLDSTFTIKTKLARTWRLTAEPCGKEVATRDFKGWKIQNTVTPSVTDSNALSYREPKKAPRKRPHGNAPSYCNGPKRLFTVTPSVTHIDIPCEVALAAIAGVEREGLVRVTGAVNA